MTFAERKTAPPTSPILNVVASVRTDAGCVRRENEDSVRHVLPNDPELQYHKGTLTIVADGMGGHAAGAIASRMAVEIISDFYYREKDCTAFEALKAAVEEANRQIFETASNDSNLSGMGTTCAVLVLQNGQALIAHVGDSRVYLLRAGELRLLTEDHSHVGEMVRRGIISPDEARRHADKNVISRALGTHPAVEVTISKPFSFEPEDEFLLCTDGLCDLLDHAEIERIMFVSGDVHAISERLVARAKRLGGLDNITAAVVKILPAQQSRFRGKVRVTREAETNE